MGGIYYYAPISSMELHGYHGPPTMMHVIDVCGAYELMRFKYQALGDADKLACHALCNIMEPLQAGDVRPDTWSKASSFHGRYILQMTHFGRLRVLFVSECFMEAWELIKQIKESKMLV